MLQLTYIVLTTFAIALIAFIGVFYLGNEGTSVK